jgi:hypothetical protein
MGSGDHHSMPALRKRLHDMTSPITSKPSTLVTQLQHLSPKISKMALKHDAKARSIIEIS